MRKVKKRSLTLVEVMIVIFIIGLIGSVVGVKMRQNMNDGKAFKTEMAIVKLYEIIELEKDTGAFFNSNAEEFTKKLTKIVTNSGLVRNPKSVLTDGWGNPFIFEDRSDDKVRFYSKRYVEYCDNKEKKAEYPWDYEVGEDPDNRIYPWE